MLIIIDNQFLTCCLFALILRLITNLYLWLLNKYAFIFLQIAFLQVYTLIWCLAREIRRQKSLGRLSYVGEAAVFERFNNELTAEKATFRLEIHWVLYGFISSILFLYVIDLYEWLLLGLEQVWVMELVVSPNYTVEEFVAQLELSVRPFEL